MKKRLLTATLMVLVVIGALAFRFIDTYGLYIFDLAIGLLAIFAALEFCKLLQKMGYYVSEMAAGLYPSFMFAGHVFSFVFGLNMAYYAIIQLSFLLAGFLLTFIISLMIKTKTIVKFMEENKLTKGKASLKIALKTFLTFLYPTTLLLSLMLLNRIDFLGISQANAFSGTFGWVALILAIIIPIITDSTAMLAGRAIGGPKLCPKISPKKTIAGSVGAVAATSILVGALYYLFTAFSMINLGFIYLGIKSYHFVILGFLGSIISQLGDLLESYLKRKAKVKDSGNIFPGHGGFLDRIDSHIVNSPFVLIYLILLIVI